MNKTIQTIALTLVIFSPFSTIGSLAKPSLWLIAPVSAHHTESHVNTVSIETSLGRRKKKTRVRTTTPKQTGAVKKKTVTPEATTDPATVAPQPATSIPPQKVPVKPANPVKTAPVSNSRIKPIDPRLGNPTAKPGSNTKLPSTDSGVPSIPLPTPGDVPNPAGEAPSIPRTTIPNLPAGTSK
jgi:septal ring-binding cell division protein DamX